MNEKQWLTLRDGAAMLDWLLSRPRPLVGDGKLRSVCHQVACPVRIELDGPDYPHHPGPWLAGWLGAADSGERALVADLLRCAGGNLFAPVHAHGCQHCYEPAPVSGGECRWCGLEVTPSALFTWEGGKAVAFARTIHEGRVWSMLPALADLVEEAGVENAALAAHLRGPGPHTRGCWALDLILGEG